MTKRSLFVVAVVGCIWSCLGTRPVLGGDSFSSLNSASTRVPSLDLADARTFPFRSAFAWMDAPNDFLPDWRPEGWDRKTDFSLAATSGQRHRKSAANSDVSDSKDYSGESVVLRNSNLLQNVHGEVGFMYGASSGGRVRQDVESAYIFGTAGDDKVQISVGAFYEHSNTDFSRRGR